MSIEAVVGRIGQIIQMQQQLSDPAAASPTAAASETGTTGSATGTQTFSSALASALGSSYSSASGATDPAALADSSLLAQPEATAEVIRDGWFLTGDLATVDDDGYYHIVGRKKDLIIRGGYNVYPREIEEVLHEHPAVAEVAVIGIPRVELGEDVGAAVVLKPGASATPEELRAFAKDRVAAYKYPRHVWLVPELPKGPTGKILHRMVQAPNDLVQPPRDLLQ